MSISSDVKKWYNNVTILYHMKGNIMKRILTLSIVLSLVISVFAACDVLVAPETPTDSADTDSTVTEALVCSEGLEYVSNGDGTCVVFSIGGCTDTDVVIPKVYDGKRVTGIGDAAFLNCSGLTSITIPDSVTSIGENAFYRCSGLTSITIPDSVTSIGYCAFERCTGLTSVVIPDSVTSIGYGAFFGCFGLTSIEIPDSVTSIGDNAFLNCTGLTSITIPDSVTSIGNGAFRACFGLTSIVIPDSVTSIGNDAFSSCFGLISMTVAEGNPVYSSEGNCLIETASKTLVAGCKNSVIPHDGSVTSIGGGAFSYCSGLTSITIPDSVTSIGDYAFEGCTGLTSVVIPDSVTSIGECAFYGCSGLTSITIPDSVTNIGDQFWDGTGLTSITFEGTMKQWNTISKGSLLNNNFPATKVICSDGTVTLR